MTGHRPFQTLRSSMSSERQARNAEATQKSLRDLALSELRAARAKSWADLASSLDLDRPAIIGIEQGTDLYLSHLRRMVEAQGGSLEVIARFATADVSIQSFADLDDAP